MQTNLWTNIIVMGVMFLCFGVTFTSSLTNANETSTLHQRNRATTDWWPMFRHDLNNSGSSTSLAPGTNDLLWIYDTGYDVDSSPVVANGKLFICSYGGLYCLDADTGIKLWNYSTGPIWEVGTPAVSDDKVFFGSENGQVYCLAADTGTMLWNYTTGYVVEHASPTIAQGNVYMLTWHGELFCFNAMTGARLWSYDLGGSSDSTAAVVNGKVYIGIGNKVYCLKADTGATLWSYTANNSVMSSPAIVNGRVYIGSMDSKVYCLNADTGAKLWEHSTAYCIGQSSPAVANGKVYIGSLDHIFYCLDADTGSLLWDYATGEKVQSSPAVADGKVFIGSMDYRLYCFDAETGARLWSYTTGNSVISSPAVAGGRLYIASTDGKVYAFGKANQPPAPPTITGPSYGKTHTRYMFLLGALTDPNGDDLYCLWDWGDGSTSTWLGPFNGGVNTSASHAWEQPGTYSIRVKIKDVWGAESNWSGPFTIVIVQLHLAVFFGRFTGLNQTDDLLILTSPWFLVLPSASLVYKDHAVVISRYYLGQNGLSMILGIGGVAVLTR